MGMKLTFLGSVWGGSVVFFFFNTNRICISEVPTHCHFKDQKLFDPFTSQGIGWGLFTPSQECGSFPCKAEWVLHALYLLYSFLCEVFCFAVIDRCKSDGTVSCAAGFLVRIYNVLSIDCDSTTLINPKHTCS